MKMRTAIPVLVAFLASPALWAQTPAAADAPGKVGVINVQAAIAGTAEGKQALAEMQSKFAPRYTELTDLQKQMDDLRSRLQTGQTTLSDEEKARLARQGDMLSRTYQRKQQELQDDSNDAQQDILNNIGPRLVDLLDKYSRQNGYAVVIDTSSQQSPVMFAANQVDVTQAIVSLFDKTYPLKSAAAPTSGRPAARPAGQSSATKSQ